MSKTFRRERPLRDGPRNRTKRSFDDEPKERNHNFDVRHILDDVERETEEELREEQLN